MKWLQSIVGKALAFPRYAAATVRLGETHQNTFAQNSTAIELLARVGDITSICANINAGVCADQQMRLYRVADNPNDQERRIARRAKRYIASGQAGRKAAGWAQMGGEVVEVEDHPVLDLLNRPNREMAGAEWAELSFYYREVCGETFDAMLGQRGQFEMVPMGPQYTQPLADPTGERLVGAYAYGRERSQMMRIEDPRYVLHRKRRQNPRDPLHGSGPMHDVYQSAEVIAASVSYDKWFTENGQVSPGIAIVDSSMDPKHMKEMQDGFRAQMNGLLGKMRMTIMKGVTQVIQPSLSARDLQSLEKREAYELRIMQAFGIPESMLRLNSANLASASTADPQYLRQTIRPRINRDAAELTEWLLPWFGLSPGEYFFAYDDPVPENTERTMAVVGPAVAQGLMTTNEAREELSLPPVEGGNKLRVNGVPLAVLSQPQPAPGVFGLSLAPMGASEPPVTPKALPEAPERPQVTTRAGKSWTDPYRDCPSCGIHTKDDDDLRQAGDIFDQAEIRTATDDIRDTIEDVMRDAVAREADSLSRGAGVVDLSDFEDQLADLLMPQVERMFAAGVTLGAEELGQDAAEFAVPPDRARAALERYVLRLTGDVTRHTEEAIVGSVRSGLDAGESIGDITRRMQADGINERYRAERIARTEVQQAVHTGKYESYKEMGITKTRWETAPGATAVHQAIAKLHPDGLEIGQPYIRAGTTIQGADGSTETFPRDVYFPPARPNCRCNIRPVGDGT